AHHREHRAIVQTMAPHSIGSGTISFGLVSIPIRMYTAASSANVAFNMLHAKCGSRIKQQTFCPVCNEVVDRASLVRGYEFSKDQYVRVADDEVRDFGEIDRGQSAKIKPGELDLAGQLIDGLSNDEFHPEQYEDEYRHRVLDLVNQKVEGKEVTVAAPQAPRAQVIDLMDAL